jgi:hypothetical protein
MFQISWRKSCLPSPFFPDTATPHKPKLSQSLLSGPLAVSSGGRFCQGRSCYHHPSVLYLRREEQKKKTEDALLLVLVQNSKFTHAHTHATNHHTHTTSFFSVYLSVQFPLSHVWCDQKVLNHLFAGMIFKVFALLSIISIASAQVCEVTCDVGNTCYTTTDKGLACLFSVPFNEVSQRKTWL